MSIIEKLKINNSKIVSIGSNSNKSFYYWILLDHIKYQFLEYWIIIIKLLAVIMMIIIDYSIKYKS